jgi:hypothetical protein
MGRSSCSRIPPREAEAFLRGLPDVRLFPHHPDRQVRAIALTDVYRSALAGLDYLVRFLGGHGIADHLLSISVDLETSLHPFLADNRHMRANVARLARTLMAELEETPDAILPDSWDLYLLGSLRHAEPQLAPAERRRSRQVLDPIERRLRATDACRYRALDAVSTDDDAEEAWERWLHQVVEARYAHDLGAAVDLESFYERTVADLTEIPFAPGYALELFNVMTHAAYGLSAYNRIPLRGHAVANRLADHGLSFLGWLRDHDLYANDPEILAAFVDAFLKGTSRGYGSTPEFGSIVRLLLDTQESDGGWHPNNAEAEDLYPLYHPTWVCVDALRPVANDLLDDDNRRLGLV